MGALAQRLAGDRREADLERLHETAFVRQPLAEHVERAQPKLAKALALAGRSSRRTSPAAGRRRARGDRARDRRDRAPSSAPRRRASISRSDPPRRSARGAAAGRVVSTSAPPAALKSPERRPEVGVRAALGRLEPERAGDVRALDRAVVQSRRRRSRVARSSGAATGLAVADELEPAEQRQLRVLRRREPLRRPGSRPNAPQQRSAVPAHNAAAPISCADDNNHATPGSPMRQQR